MLAGVQVAGLRRYERVALVAWDCLTAAGDASAAWSACSNAPNATALRLEEGLGWHGRVPLTAGDDRLLRLATTTAGRAWHAIAQQPGDLALGVSTSKGDPGLWERVLAGEPGLLIAALPGQLTPLLARALRCGPYQPAPVAAACSTGLYALLECADHIEDRRCARALAGAVDLSLTPLLIAGFRALGVLCGNRRPQAFGEPTGFAPAEGAGIVALGTDGPWRLVASVRLGDARHETEFRDPATLYHALAALWQAAPMPELIVTHGTGTARGDAYERAGLDAGPWRDVPRLHCKPTIGHCLGASAAVELAIGLEAPVRRLWKLGLGFGGHLAAVAVERG
jgi:Beta-ketoacyl synthase, N-terminal domain/Beta-ketoacyl synthase, C-terminal domain